jgi:bacterioferritin
MKTKINRKGNIGHNLLSYNDINKLSEMLNALLSNEWLTYYQSWMGAILMEGPLKNKIKNALLIHANQELNHAVLIKTRMLELGINPVIYSSESNKIPRCQVPGNPYIEVVLDQNMENELLSIGMYREIADFTFRRDEKTYQLVIKILKDELHHAQRIEKWRADIQRMKAELKIPNIQHFALA